MSTGSTPIAGRSIRPAEAYRLFDQGVGGKGVFLM
jgi:hypothetical protein